MAKKDSVELLKGKIKVLKLARTRIKNHKDEYVCHAIINCGWTGYHFNDPLREAKGSLRNYIAKVLAPCELTSWLRCKKKKWDTSGAAMRQHRLQWIDWMIASLEDDLHKHPTYVKRGLK